MKVTQSAGLHLCSIFLVLCLVGAQQSPTERLNQERKQQQQANYRAQQEARWVNTRRLAAPCVVPESYYPLRTCRVSNNPKECGRGFNAWANFQQCCQPGQYGAFPRGCTDLNRPVQCWIPGQFFPERTCQPSTNLTRCSFNWGQWPTEDECCAPGRAFPEGCSLPEPCWVGTEWFPERKCATTDDRAICNRGWGTYDTQQECCAADAAFSKGCGISEEADEAEFGEMEGEFEGPGAEEEEPRVVAAQGPPEHQGTPGHTGEEAEKRGLLQRMKKARGASNKNGGGNKNVEDRDL